METETAALINGAPKPKPNGRISELERKVNTLAWLHAELAHRLKLAAAQQLLANPTVQAQLREAIMARMA